MAARYRITLLLFLLVAVPAPGQTETPATTRLPFKVVRSVMLVEITVDNQRKTLVFDTGAERTMIQSPQNVEQLVTLSFANKTVRGFPIVLLDLRKQEMQILGADGILGQDFLSSFSRIVIDYTTRTIELQK